MRANNSGKTAADKAEVLRKNAWLLSEMVAQLDALYEESEGEQTPTIEAIEAAVSETEANIIEGLCWYRREIEARVKTLGEYAARLSAQKAAMGARSEWAKSMIAACLERRGSRRVDAGPFSISFRAGSQRVVRDEGASIYALPEELVKHVEPKPDLPEITKRLKAGEEVPGFRLERGPESLQVRGG